MLGLKLNHVRQKGPRTLCNPILTHCHSGSTWHKGWWVIASILLLVCTKTWKQSFSIVIFCGRHILRSPNLLLCSWLPILYLAGRLLSTTIGTRQNFILFALCAVNPPSWIAKTSLHEYCSFNQWQHNCQMKTTLQLAKWVTLSCRCCRQLFPHYVV